MDPFGWRPFLERYSRELLADKRIRSELPEEVVISEWMGSAPASEGELLELEDRLGKRLPPSYRQFLATTNGWRATGYFIGQIWPATSVDWFRVHNQDWIDAYLEPGQGEPPLSLEEHLVYGKQQDSCRFRCEYLQSTLQISAMGDSAVYLLGPEVQTPSGEWEAWFFGNWLPGARRYRSFWDLLQEERQAFLVLKDHNEKRLHPGQDPQLVASKLPGLIEELKRREQSWRRVRDHQRGKAPSEQLPYYDGLMDALLFAKSRVEEIRVQSEHPVEIVEQLRGFAGELEGRWQEGTRAIARVCSLGHNAGLAEGYREAMGIVHWFLNQR
jgi:hypothetical protein